MIHGEYKDGIAIINTRWSQRRLYFICGLAGHRLVECYVWGENLYAALESAAEWAGVDVNGKELFGKRVTGLLYIAIKIKTNAYNNATRSSCRDAMP